MYPLTYMMLIQTYIGPSGIHGMGLFVAEPVAKGTRIWEFMEGLDVVIPQTVLDHAKDPVRAYLARYTYPHPARTDMLVLDGDNGRFMNHSDTPNTDFTVPAIGVALVDMHAGTELTCNYGEFAPGFVLD